MSLTQTTRTVSTRPVDSRLVDSRRVDMSKPGAMPDRMSRRMAALVIGGISVVLWGVIAIGSYSLLG